VLQLPLPINGEKNRMETVIFDL